MNALINVIQAELFKSLRKKRSYILAGLLWVLLPALVLIVARILQINLSGSFVEDTVSLESILQTVASPFGIARISLMLPAFINPSYYIIFISLFAALFIGEERNQNMWKTTLTAQPNRLAVLFGKLVVAMVMFGILLLGSYLSSVLFGTLGMLFLPTNFSGEWFSLLGLYTLQWLFGLAAILFAFVMIWLLRNVALGIVSVFFLPALIEGLYTIYAATVGFQPLNRFNALFQYLRLQRTLEELPRYFFTSNLYAPARAPLNTVVSTLGGDVNNSDDLGPLASLIGSDITLQSAAMVMAVYAALFASILIWRFLRRDVG